jgi:hypothetical protein
LETATWAFIGVVAGGLLTIMGQAVAEVIKAHVAMRDIRERRAQVARELQRETLTRLLDAVADYRRALSRYDFRRFPSQDDEGQLASARVAYQMMLHRVSSASARDAVRSWETAALYWFQGDERGTANDEAEAWATAMRLTGEAIRATE